MPMFAPSVASGPSGVALATVAYNPASLATYTTSSTSFVAVDATNLTISFTVPASGKVIIVLEAAGKGITATTDLWWAVGPHSGGVATGSGGSMTSLSNSTRCRETILLTGLTPGAAVQYDWLYGSDTTGQSVSMFAGGTGLAGSGTGAAIMAVYAA